MEQQIRYTKRICHDKEKIDRFLHEARVGTLSMCETAFQPYALPINYIYHNGKIYFHGMGSGKKNEVLAANPAVCFTVFTEYGTVADSMPAKCDTAYFSVVIFGKASLVEEIEEKTAALRLIVGKFVPGLFANPLSSQFVKNYHSGFDDKATAVFCIEPEVMTAKENPVDLDNMFCR